MEFQTIKEGRLFKMPYINQMITPTSNEELKRILISRALLS
jgi:hypothetical protein